MTVARPHFLSDLVEMSHCQPHLCYSVHSYKRENTCSIKLLYPGGSSCHHVRFKMSKYHKTQLYYFKIGCPPKSRTFKNIKKSLKQTDSRLVKHRFLSFLFWLHNKAENKSSTSLKHTLSTAGLRKDNGESPGVARTTHRPASPWTHSEAQMHSFRGCRGFSGVQPTHIENGQAAAPWVWPPASPHHNRFPPCGHFLSLPYASITQQALLDSVS